MNVHKHTSWTAKVTGYLRRGPGALSHVIKSRPTAVHCEINLLLNVKQNLVNILTCILFKISPSKYFSSKFSSSLRNRW